MELSKNALKRIVLVCFALQTITSSLCAQSIAEIDNQLARSLKKIDYWSNYDYRDNNVDRGDSLDKANAQLSAYLLRVGSKVPGTLTASFPKASKNGLGIVSSKDQKLRLYTWDSHLGGTMVMYYNVVQFNASGKIKATEIMDSTVDADYGSNYRDIVIEQTKDNKVVYLVFGYNKISTKDRAESITAYIIEQGALKKYNFFKTKTKTINSIEYGYDAFSSSDKLKMDDLPGIHLSEDKGQLLIPIVDGEVLTTKCLIYQFDGMHYVYIGVGK